MTYERFFRETVFATSVLPSTICERLIDLET